MSFKISVCMIIKNESKILDRCLKCVKEFADEIIIIDTGSSDNSKKIALNYTKNVFDYSWSNDFSKARNFAFSFAKCEYIMWLDADDFISRENINKIKRLKNSNTNFDVFMCKYKFDLENNASFWFYRERIVRRQKNFQWQGFIHEAIICDGKIKYTNIEIEHRPTKNKNPRRNLQIYNWHIKNGETLNTRHQYYYAKELFYNGYYYSAQKALKKYLKMPNKLDANEIDAYITLSKIRTHYHSIPTALNYLFQALNQCIPTSELLCLIADSYADLMNYNKAIFFYECALNCALNNTTLNFVNTNYYYLYPLLQLTFLYYKIGDIKQSKYYHSKCMQKYSYDKRVIYNDNYFKYMEKHSK